MLKTILRRRVLLRRLPPPPYFPAPNSNSPSPPPTSSTLFPSNSEILSSLPRWNLRELMRRSFSSNPNPNPNPNKCWNCNCEPDPNPQRLPFLFCDTCRAIQPVDHSIDYFQIFGLEKKYEIVEVGNLEGKYKDWQKKLHPDLVHSKSQNEREFAAEQSARVIDAYHTLKSPLSRAIYILRLEGVNVNEEETVSEPELLAEIMEIREAVEEAPDSKALNEIQSLMQQKLQHWSNSFANALQSQDFGEALTCIHRMTYYDRVKEEIVKRL